MATAGNIITTAFAKIGIDSPTNAQTASALTALNNLISMLGAEGLNYYTIRESKALTIGDAEYTIGSGGDLNTVRPQRLLSCFVRNSDNYDWPVKVISAQRYNDIQLKSQDGRPTEVYFLPEYTLAKVIFSHEPDVAYTAYFDFEKNLTEFAATTDTVSLPNEYKEMLVYNLAVSLAEDWDRVISKTIYSMAERTKAVIDRLNASNRPVAESKFDFMFGGTYDITTDSRV